MLPTTIQEVITELEQIMDTCTRTGNRLGFFAALYHKTTCRVRDGILAGDFEDDARMERLDVVFANHYINAWRLHQEGKPVPKPWDVAFKSGKSRQTLVLQHMLLGMNAHINYDLGIATVEVAGTNGLSGIRKDFNAINGILALMTGDVMNSLRRVSPLLSLMGLHSTRYNSILIQFSISNARDGAWCFAEDLYGAQGAGYAEILAAREKAISDLATGLTKARGLMRITLWAIHLFEWRRPAKIIKVLREGGPSKISAEKVDL